MRPAGRPRIGPIGTWRSSSIWAYRERRHARLGALSSGANGGRCSAALHCCCQAASLDQHSSRPKFRFRAGQLRSCTWPVGQSWRGRVPAARFHLQSQLFRCDIFVALSEFFLGTSGQTALADRPLSSRAKSGAFERAT